MRPKITTLSGPQLDIMKIVWRLGEATVRNVYEELRTQRTIAYTTVMTTMKNMESKGHLKKHNEGRAFVYTATAPESRMLKRIVSDFIDRVFNGSAEPLLMHLVREQRLTEKDLKKIQKLLQEQEKP